MRNLKRALSLAVSTVMLIGMMAVGTSAASYADVTSAHNEEAIEVAQAISVMVGDENGNFNPDKNVTRAEMAVVMANLLDLKVQDFVGASIPFTDVPEWAHAYVAACYADGITGGISATQYGSNNSITAVQAALMMMKALGYFQYAKDFGTDWQVATIKQASNIGLYDGIDSARNAAMTRNEVAQLALNTLKTTMVESDGSSTDITLPGDITISTGGTKYVDVTSTSAYARAFGDKAVEGSKYTVELGEKLFDGDLKLNPSATDDFGAPSNRWTYKAKEIGSYAADADVTYTAEVKSKDLYSDLGLGSTTKADVVVDGAAAGTFTIQKGSSTTFDKSGNGVLVNAYLDDNENVTLVVINTYVGKISKVTPAKDGDAAYVTVDGLNYETEGYAKDDVVIYTKANGDIQSMQLAEVIEGVEVSRVNGTSSFVADGTTYKFNKNITFSSDVKVDSILDLYVDANGYVVKVDVSKASSDYAYVIDTGADEGRYSDDANYYAKLLLADGTQVEADVDKDCLSGSNFSGKKGSLSDMKGDIVEYTKDSKDVYTLKVVSTGEHGTTGTGQNVEINKGESGMKLNSGTNNYYANSKTIFLVQSGEGSKATYTAYVGYANVPDMKDSSGNFAVYCKTGTVATMVFISGVSTSSDDIVYVLASKSGTKVNDTDAGVYYEYKAVVNGEITTVKMDETIKDSYPDGSGVKTDVLFGSIYYADTEYDILDASACTVYSSKSQDPDDYAMSGKITAEPEDDIIGISGENYAVSSDVEYYAVTAGDKIEAGSEGDLVKDKTTVTAIVKNGEIVTIFYGATVKTNDPVTDKISGDVTATQVVNSNELKTMANGAYVLSKKPTDIASDLGGEAKDNLFFKFITSKENEKVALKIVDNTGKTMYYEEAEPFSVIGGHFFYVQVIGSGINNTTKDYPMSDKALDTGSYDWSVVSSTTGETLASGSFSIG